MKFSYKVLGLVLMLSTSACGYSNAKRFEKLLEKQSGQSFSIAKLDTEVAGYVVFRNDTTGEYVAYNLNKFDRKNQKSLSAYLAVATGVNDIVHNLAQNNQWVASGYWAGGFWQNTYASYTTCDANGNCVNTWYVTGSYYVQPYYVNTSYNYTWYAGNGMRFNSAQSAIKDLETLGAIIEDTEQSLISKTLTVKYGLSQPRAETLAKLSSQYKQITSDRELSVEDKDYFAKQAFGVDYSQYESALKQSALGDAKGMDALITKAAIANGTNPEQARKILNEITGSGAE